MKSSLFLCTLLILAGFKNIFSQPLVTDFKISQDNSPSTIIQNNPKIFLNDTLGFLLTWTDYREGESEIYAQQFDRSGNKVGDNFKIFGNDDILYKSESHFLSIKSVSYDYAGYFPGNYNLVGRILNPPTMLNDTLYLGFGSIPTWCATGWLGISHSTFYHKNKFRCFFSDGGRVTLRDFNALGSFSNQKQIPISSAAWVNAVKLKDNDYSLFWFNGYPNSGKIGLYGNFYDSNDQIYSEKVLVAWDSVWRASGWVIPSTTPKFCITSVNDTLYQIFWISTDSLNRNLFKIFYKKFDRFGNKIEETLSIPITSAKFYLYYLQLTNVFNNKFSLVVSSLQTYPQLSKFNAIYDFYSDGTFTGDSTIDTSLNFRFDKFIFKYDEDKYFVGFSDGKDAFRATFHNFTLGEYMKVNDDISGSNEANPVIINKDENTNLIFWKDEVSSQGRFVNTNGNFVGEEKLLNAVAIQLLPNGNGIGLWLKDMGNNYFNGGFVYFDNQLNELRRDTFLAGGLPINLQYGVVTYRVLNDTSIVILYRVQGQTRARSVDANGSVKKDILLSTDASTYYIRIFKHDNDNIYLNWNGLIQLSDNELNLKGLQFKGYMDLYFGEHKYMQIRYMQPEYAASYHEGFIYSVFGDTLKKNIRFVEGSKDFSIFEINSQLFYAVYNLQGKYYVRAYKSDGTPLQSPVVIHDNSKSNKKNFYLLEKSDRTYFAWADNRNGNYDIYSNIYRTMSLTDVKNESFDLAPNGFQLFQNYPNPFNSISNIKFQTAKLSYVKMKVYDILGREVKTLLNEEKPPGEYEIQFTIRQLTDDSRLTSSGVYFYQLRAGDFIETKKMIYMK